jgi:RimJ/RimL family protein N-acetyltransferase
MDFELQPVLKGDLLELRPVQSQDFEELYAVASDPLIWEQHPNFDRYQKEVFKIFFQGAIDSKGALVAIDKVTGKIIGSSRYHGFDPLKKEVEIGWTFLGRQFWGGKYNREMKRLMLNHAFQFVESVVFIIGERNFRSQKAVQKIGAVFIGPRLDEERINRVAFQITLARWLELKTL